MVIILFENKKRLDIIDWFVNLFFFDFKFKKLIVYLLLFISIFFE